MASEPSEAATPGTDGARADPGDDVLLSVRELRKYYPVRGGLLRRKTADVKAVDGVSFDVRRGETLGLAGESGCGKTTVVKTILGLVERTAGTIRFDGQDVTTTTGAALRALRADIGVVFQDPFSSLDPRMTVRKIVAEPLRTHTDMSDDERTERVLDLLERVGLNADHANRYPHEFSGGQRQRIAIARALALEPSFVVLDEPTSALDVSVQARILGLLDDLQDELELTYLFITHDLNVMRQIADRILVMYLGRIAERGPTEAVFASPHHPYTEALLSAVPQVGRRRDPILLEGEVPSPRDPPSGCRFHTRCPYVVERCAESEPPLADVSHLGDRPTAARDGDGERPLEEVHESRCLFADPRAEPPVPFED